MSVRILTGDCRKVLAALPAASVHCIVTSPPYFGLRDYGTATWEGGDPACEHTVGGQVPDSKAPGAICAGVRPGVDASRCRKCGARRIDAQIGLERTPDAYVAEMVAVFREARRVLRDDGTLWLNIGDSYARNPAKGQHKPGHSGKQAGCYDGGNGRASSTVLGEGLKDKDLIGIPWMLAFALRADGWYLRQDIIWAKPNAMPESVQDRCTKAHEYVFLLSKRERYFYDAEAISEPARYPDGPGNKTQKYTTAYRETGDERLRTKAGLVDIGPRDTRNRRSVWTIATEPSGIAHFAMMPTALAELCIKAGCPQGGTVLDPFGGAGTTGIVADRIGRSAVLIELNPANASIATDRLRGDAGMFAMVAAE
jgi:DNA modification methylase